MESFRQVLQQTDLRDMGYRGPKYTWANNREGEAFTKERIDRVCANSQCNILYQDVFVNTVAACNSNHHFLIINMNTQCQFARRKTRVFRYEYCWG